MQTPHKIALSTMAVLALGLIFPLDSLAQAQRDRYIDGYNVYCIAVNEKETTGWVSSIFYFKDRNGYSNGVRPYKAEDAWEKYLKDKHGVTKFRINECRTFHPIAERRLLNKGYRFESQSSSRTKMIRTRWVFKDRESRRGDRR